MRLVLVSLDTPLMLYNFFVQQAISFTVSIAANMYVHVHLVLHPLNVATVLYQDYYYVKYYSNTSIPLTNQIAPTGGP